MKCFLDAEVAEMQLAIIRYRKLRNAILHPELLDGPQFARMMHTAPSPAALDALVDLLPDSDPGLPPPVRQA
jgi:hypothetical protein